MQSGKRKLERIEEEILQAGRVEERVAARQRVAHVLV